MEGIEPKIPSIYHQILLQNESMPSHLSRITLIRPVQPQPVWDTSLLEWDTVRISQTMTSAFVCLEATVNTYISTAVLCISNSYIIIPEKS